ncbi:MAG: hypothetical protein ACHQ1F_10700, partial [Spirochaetia bacterium]
MAASIRRFLHAHGPAARAGVQIDMVTDPVLIDNRKGFQDAGHGGCAEDLDLEKLFTGTLIVPAGPAFHSSFLFGLFSAYCSI